MLSKLRSTLVCTFALLLHRKTLLHMLAAICAFATAEQQALASATTTTTLAITANGAPASSVSPGTVVTLTASVTSAGTSVAPGQITFYDASAPSCTDIHLLGTAQLTVNGTATVRFVPGPGSHSYKAVFLGTHNFTGSPSLPESLSVATVASASTTTITSSGVPGNYTLTATVTNATNIPPTGTVSFLDTDNANYVLGTGLLSIGPSSLSLANGPTYPTGELPGSILTADFNGDGILDIAVVAFDSLGTYVPGSITILLGNGDGTFTAAPNIATGTFPCCLATADFNGDGIPDLVVGSLVDGTVRILLGNGDGTFVTGPSIINGTFADVNALAAGDFNGDGNEDLVGVDAQTDTVFVLLGHGDGTFAELPARPATGDNPVVIVVGDFNGDGKLDLAIDNIFAPNSKLTPTTLTILLGNGDGTFTPAPPVPVGIGPESLVTADFNGDGKLDLAVANIQPPANVMVLLGNGDGTFAGPVSTIPIIYLNTLTVGDFNGDGKPDIAAFEEVGQTAPQNVYALLGNGDGTFATATGGSGNIIPTNGVAGDFNGDGLWDIAVPSEYGGVTIFLSNTTGPATATVTNISPVGMGIHYVDASYPGDTNNTPSLSGLIPLVAEPVPTTLALSTNPSGSVAPGQLLTLTATLTPDLAQNHNATGTVTFSSNGSALGTGSISNGIATLSTSTLPAGSDPLLAAYSGDTNFDPSSASASGTVNTLSTLPSTAILTVVPASSVFGSPVTLTATVSATNPPGPSVPTGTVTFTYNTSTNPANITLGTVNLNAGVASFTTTTLPVGEDNINCTYSGSSIYSPATCVNQPASAGPALTLSSSLNPAPALAPITFTAQLGSGNSGGTIVFAINGQNIPTTPNAYGTSIYTISTLTAGTYPITATWFASAHALAIQASLTQVVTALIPVTDFSLTGSSITFPFDHSATGNLQLTSINGFAGNVAIACIPPFPPNYTCTLQHSSISLTSGLSTVFTYTLSPSFTASATPSHPVNRSTRIVLASLFPFTLVSLLGLSRKRRTHLRTLLSLTLLAILATATTACGPDHFIPITTGVYPLTFTATGTDQGTSTPITHTLTINATITQ
jgi:hypothetical protein